MNWTLTNDEDVFVISDGQSRIHRVAENHSGAMDQQTPVAVRLRALFATGFPDRATRGMTLPLVVSFPPCADNAAAYTQSMSVPLACPRGGVLTGLYSDFLVTFNQAWVKNITFVTEGLSNVFTFNLEAVDPVLTIPAPSPLSLMDPQYVANLSAVTNLTGGTSSDLDGIVTADASVGRLVDIIITLSGVTVRKGFQLIAGTDAENTDPDAGPLIIRPDDFHATTNPKVWFERS